MFLDVLHLRVPAPAVHSKRFQTTRGWDLLESGFDAGSFDIAVGWADYPLAAASPEELLAAATASLERAEYGRSSFGEAGSPTTAPAPAPGT